MSWTVPKTWTPGELVTAADLNAHLRDNLTALKAPPTACVQLDESADYTTTSQTFVDIDSDTLALDLTTQGGDVLIGFSGSFRNAGGYRVYLDVEIDDGDSPWCAGGDDGLVGELVSAGTGLDVITFTYLLTGLAAGSYTLALQWRVGAGTATLFAGAGTTGADLHPQFWAREVS